jgi:hypothetical protein
VAAQPVPPGVYVCNGERLQIPTCGSYCLVRYLDRPPVHGQPYDVGKPPDLVALELRDCRENGGPRLAPQAARQSPYGAQDDVAAAQALMNAIAKATGATPPSAYRPQTQAQTSVKGRQSAAAAGRPASGHPAAAANSVPVYEPPGSLKSLATSGTSLGGGPSYATSGYAGGGVASGATAGYAGGTPASMATAGYKGGTPCTFATAGTSGC